MGGVGDLVRLLTWLMPPWALAALAVVGFLLALPGLRHGMRVRQLKGAVRRLEHLAPGERAQRERQALELAGADPHLLALLARHARKRTMPALYQEALRRLATDPANQRLAAQVRNEVAREQPGRIDPALAAVKVEQLLDAGLREAAREHLSAALAQHPSHPALLAAQERLQQPTAEGSERNRLDLGDGER
jgi:hypothetical protein